MALIYSLFSSPSAFKKIMLAACNIGECTVCPLLFSLTNQVFLETLHRASFSPQESQAAALSPVREAVPRTSMCSVQSAPPEPPTSVSEPLSVMSVLPCTCCCVLPADYLS